MSTDTVEARNPGPVRVQGNVVEVALFAPGKQRVALVGEFNGWDAAADVLQESDGCWRLHKELPPGRYAYGFEVDGVRIADPYAREAEWENAKAATTYVTVGGEPFAWKQDSFVRPPYQDLIIYEILVNDFSPEGTFRGVTERLDHLERLGINCIELMPLTSGPPRDHWGYHPVFYFAPDARYGTAAELRELVDAAHGRGMAVILDVCLAHSGKQHPFLQLYAWHESPWYGEPFGGQNEFGLPSFDYSKPATQAFSRQVLEFWLREFHIDGYRLDYAKLIGERDGMGIPQVLADIRRARPEAYIVTEMLPEKPDYINRWDVNGSWHESLQNTLTDNLTLDLIADEERKPEESWQHLLRALNPVAEDYCRADLCVNFVGNHDEERMMRVLLEKGLPEDEALRRVELVTALVFCMSGPPLMFHGEEWGERTEKKISPNPIHWDLLETESGGRLFQFFQRCIALRKEHPALRSPHVKVEGEDSPSRCLRLYRWTEGGEFPASEAALAVNLSAQMREMHLELRDGSWQVVLAAREVDHPERYPVALPPFSFVLWVKC